MKPPKLLLAALLLAAFAAPAQVPTLINYQGRLSIGGTNFDATGQFKFALVNTAGTVNYWANDGVATGQPATAVSLTVTKGLYAVLLGDTTVTGMSTAIPATVFTNSDVRLRVWFNDGTNGFQQLTPDQRIAAVGYALVASTVQDGAITSAKISSGAVGATQLAAGAVTLAKLDTTGAANGQALTFNGASLAWTTPTDATLSNKVFTGSSTFSGANTFNNAANSFTGSGAALTSLNAANIASGSLPDARLSANIAFLNGTNSLTGTNTFSGKIVSSGANSFTGANTFNNAGNSFTGAFTGNGSGLTNIPSSSFSGTIAAAQLAAGSVTSSAIAANAVTSAAIAANAIGSSQIAAGAVGSSQLANASVSTSQLNLSGLATTLWQAGGNAGTTPGTHYLGTSDNKALQLHVNGARALRLEPNTNGAPNVIGGSPLNFAASGVAGAFIGGGGATNYGGSAYTNAVNASFGTVTGGALNVIDATGLFATIGGGYDNEVSGNSATVAGGFFNLASGLEATIGGGQANLASGSVSFVGGGVTNTASGFESAVVGGEYNAATGTNAFIGAGYGNGATNFAVVGGGYGNFAGGKVSFVGGGTTNYATGFESAVAGGELNAASGTNAFVGGGYNNGATNTGAVVAGGSYNLASGVVSAIGGGYYNGATGYGATVPGGYANLASGSNSLAAGYVAAATNHGAFVWSDYSSTTTFGSTAANQFSVRAAGGVRFATTSAGTVGAQLLAGATAWSILSDRNAKKDFAPVDGREVLRKLDEVPVQSWRYTWDDGQSTPHLGPVAQDFKAAFYPGRDDKSISTLEFDGVELAAIQGLHALVKEKDAKISALERRLADIEAKLEKLAK